MRPSPFLDMLDTPSDNENTNFHPAHAPHSVPALKAFPDKLYVVAVISNPVRYLSRYRLYRTFEKHMQDSGVILYTVECAFGGRPFEVTQAGNPHHIQVRTNSELWHKENLINLGISRLPAEAKYIAWIDADIQFARSDWAQETLQQLQHYSFVQLFSQAIDLGPNSEPLQTCYGWVESYEQGYAFPGTKKPGANGKSLQSTASFYGLTDQAAATVTRKGIKPMYVWHSGYAWAARREALNAVGGLIDFAILGSSDHNMAAALYGRVNYTLEKGCSAGYRAAFQVWQDRADRCIRQNVGQVPGTITHSWHGRKAQRGYLTRGKILVDYQFDPNTDLVKDTQGLWQLADHGGNRSIGLRDAIRAYFRARNEDGTEV